LRQGDARAIRRPWDDKLDPPELSWLELASEMK